MKRHSVLITGITGFVGSHLAESLLRETNSRVYGLVRWRSPLEHIERILMEHPYRLTLVQGDLNDPMSLHNVWSNLPNIEVVYHLAAQSYVPYSYKAPAETFQTNAIGSINLFNAILQHTRWPPIVHVCSSSEVYGNPDTTPITEDFPLRPLSPYGVSKAAMDMAAYQYYKNYDLPTIRTRAFTHTGPRRGDVFVASAFAKQIARAELLNDSSPMIYVGNLNSVRTWCDVRDMVAAYQLAVQRCDLGEVYNVGGNTTCTVGDMLDMLLSKSKLKHPVVTQSQELLRASDVTLQIPDISKFQGKTGWAPHYTLDKTLTDLLEYHRAKVRA